LLYENRRVNIHFRNGVMTVLPEDTEDRWGFDTGAVVLHVEHTDRKMKDYSRVTFQRWDVVLNGICGETVPRRGMWRFLFPKAEAVRLTVIAMATGIVMIAFNEVWRIKKFLGSGGFADVYAASSREGVTGAVKISRRKFSSEDHAAADKAWRKTQQEVEVIRQMQGCAHVPQLYGAYMLRAREGSKLTTTLCYVMQWLPISLRCMRKVRTFSELEVRPIIRDVLCALQYFHTRDVVHRDVKISNIMMQSEAGPAYLVDFGFAKPCHMEGLHSRAGYIAGTAGYLAPELFQNRVGKRADIFACGIVFYNLVSSTPAFNGGTVEEVLQSNKRGDIDFSQVKHLLSTSGMEMCQLQTHSCRSSRPTATNCLSHAWFRQPGSALNGFPPRPDSPRYQLQLRGAQVLAGSNEKTSQSIPSSQTMLDMEESGLVGIDLLLQYKNATQADSLNSPFPKNLLEGEVLNSAPVRKPGSDSGDEFSLLSAVGHHSDTFAGTWGSASRSARSCSKSRDGRDTHRSDRYVGDLIHGGILESLRRAGGGAPIESPRLSEGFELSLRSIADDGASKSSPNAVDMILHTHVLPKKLGESPGSSRESSCEPQNRNRCEDDGAEKPVLIGVSDTIDTFLRRALERQTRALESLIGHGQNLSSGNDPDSVRRMPDTGHCNQESPVSLDPQPPSLARTASSPARVSGRQYTKLGE
jgi:serine/threonine-protein kinase